MMIEYSGLLAVGLMLAAPVQAQEAGARQRTIVVEGTGQVMTPPDLTSIRFTVRGEGTTADAATKALVAKQKAIVDGVTGVLKNSAQVETGTVNIAVTRAGECRISNYNSAASLSTGPCAIAGYVATLSTTVRSKDVADAATAVGLAGRLGAENASVQSYELNNTEEARTRATAKAMDDARAQAQAIAGGSHVTLGDILSVRNGAARIAYNDIVVTEAHAPPAPPPPPPVAIKTTPAPIETTVRLQVIYAISG